MYSNKTKSNEAEDWF